MVLNVCHKWPSGCRFVFNMYKHWSVLIVRNGDKALVIIQSREGVRQGDPLAMIAYAILLLPLIRHLKREISLVEQPWYDDDAAAGGNFEGILEFLKMIQEFGPKIGYHPEPSKSVLVVSPANIDRARHVFKDIPDLKIVSGHRYLGGFIGTADTQSAWVNESVEKWTEAVRSMSAVAEHYPQTTFVGMAKSLQQEWQFLQHVTNGSDLDFAPLENALRKSFLPALLQEKDISPDMRKLIGLSVKSAGMSLPNPVETPHENHTTSTVCTSHLARAIRGQLSFNSTDHQTTMNEGKTAHQERRNSAALLTFKEATASMKLSETRALARGKETGAWLSCTPSFVNGTQLEEQEFRDALRLRYNLTPLNLPSNCDGCAATFTVDHALSCMKGGLIILRHNEMRNELISVCQTCFSKGSVRDEPNLNTITNNLQEKSKVNNEKENIRPRR